MNRNSREKLGVCMEVALRILTEPNEKDDLNQLRENAYFLKKTGEFLINSSENKFKLHEILENLEITQKQGMK